MERHHIQLNIWNVYVWKYTHVVQCYDTESRLTDIFTQACILMCNHTGWCILIDRFKKHSEILDLGENIDWLAYTSLISAIPSIWKIQLKDITLHKLNDAITPMEYYTSKISPSQAMFWNYIETKNPNKDACPTLWSTDLQDKVDKDAWNNLYLFKMRITISTKLRYFQYKVLNRTITTNTKRSRWDPDISPLCHFCGNHRETILHLLVHCKTIAPLW